MKQEFDLQLPALLYFVKASCHENLHDTISALRDLSETIHSSPTVMKYVHSFLIHLQRHLSLEENNFFPFLGNGLNQEDVIDHLADDHNQLKESLLTLRKMTQNYQDSLEDGSAEAKFYQMLKELDRILLNHIQIEDHILFPMVRANRTAS